MDPLAYILLCKLSIKITRAHPEAAALNDAVLGLALILNSSMFCMVVEIEVTHGLCTDLYERSEFANMRRSIA